MAIHLQEKVPVRVRITQKRHFQLTTHRLKEKVVVYLTPGEKEDMSDHTVTIQAKTIALSRPPLFFHLLPQSISALILSDKKVQEENQFPPRVRMIRIIQQTTIQLSQRMRTAIV